MLSLHVWAALQVNLREEELLSLLSLAAVRLDASERRLALTQQACNPVEAATLAATHVVEPATLCIQPRAHAAGKGLLLPLTAHVALRLDAALVHVRSGLCIKGYRIAPCTYTYMHMHKKAIRMRQW